MRQYQIWLNGMTKFVEVTAEDVNVEVENGKALFWNFTVKDGENFVTVAGFPFDNVEYVVSEAA